MCCAKINQNTKEALTKQQKKAVEKIADEGVSKMREYEEKLDILGERNSYSKTDPGATFMRMKEDAMNDEWMDNHDIEAYVKYNMFHAEDKRKMRNNPFLVRNMYYNADEYRAKAKERLTSEEGLCHRSMRSIEPEAVFGDIKYDHGFKRFRLKGMVKVSVGFGLVALAHNLRKYARV